MNIKIAAYSDIGIKKNTNQDSYLLKTALLGGEQLSLAVLCDGMGGLSKGELASATVIRAFDHWFQEQFPELLQAGFQEELLKTQWNEIVRRENIRLSKYADIHGCKMGTTVVACLLFKDQYYIMNVGDSRAYAIYDCVYQITKDQTLVQYQVDQGILNLDETESHPQRNVLLQCVGASDIVSPDFYNGDIVAGTVFLLCSDGFRHVLSVDEMYEKINPFQIGEEEEIRQRIIDLIEINKNRGEVDNISAIAMVWQEE